MIDCKNVETITMFIIAITEKNVEYSEAYKLLRFYLGDEYEIKLKLAIAEFVIQSKEYSDLVKTAIDLLKYRP
jgi:hypothetical protein